MIYKGLLLPAIHDLCQIDGKEVLSRFPNVLNDTIGNRISHNLYSQEIRLIPEETVTIELEACTEFQDNKCEVYYGDFGPAHEISFQKTVSISIEPFSVCGASYEQLPQPLKRGSFDPRVVRILLLCKSAAILSVKGKFHLPEPEQMPQKRMLVYGTSLSQGTSTHLAQGAFPWLVARRLGMDVDNYALAGCCLLEDPTIDFLTSLNKDYDLILLEPSTNLYARGYGVSEFKRRTKHLIQAMRTAYPRAPIVCIDLFVSLFDFGFTGGFSPAVSCEEYRTALSDVIQELNMSKVYLVRSSTLLDPYNLCVDLLHPTSIGYFQIAEELLRYIARNGVLGE